MNSYKIRDAEQNLTRKFTPAKIHSLKVSISVVFSLPNIYFWDVYVWG